MLLYITKDYKNKNIAIIQFGIGLLGSAIKKNILNKVIFEHVEVFNYSLDWDKENLYNKQLLQLTNNSRLKCVSKIHIIWSAGKAGFQSNKDEAETQYHQFKLINTLLSNTLKELSIPLKFHLLSSAGGIFEGQVSVNKNSIPSPKRPYGHLKLKEEELILNNNIYNEFEVLRISTAYSTSASKRKGLIQVLIENSIQNKETHIFGNESTLRDYVLDEDIANYMVTAMYNSRVNEKISFLVSGKPSSIFEIRKSIEKITHKKLYVIYSTVKSNSLNISFSSSVVARGFNSIVSLHNLKIQYQKLNYNGSVIL